jgi:nucleotide-binding universal stress UspA family protein
MAQAIPITKYEHIALLTDLTSKSHAALSYARAFAQYYSTRLTLVHALADPPFPQTHYLRQRPSQAVRAELQTVRNALRLDGIDAHIHLSESAPPRGLVRAVRLLRPDLIVQGTAGIKDARRAVVGSIAESIFRRVDIPVLTVGSRIPPLIQRQLCFESVLMMTDFGERSQQIAVYALSLAQEFRSRVSLCHVHDGRFAAWQKGEVERFFDHALSAYVTPPVKDWCDPESVVAFGELDAQIDSLMHQKKPDLILMGAHSLGLLGTRGKPGTAFKVIARATCPVLTLLDTPQELPESKTWSDMADLAILG